MCHGTASLPDNKWQVGPIYHILACRLHNLSVPRPVLNLAWVDAHAVRYSGQIYKMVVHSLGRRGSGCLNSVVKLTLLNLIPYGRPNLLKLAALVPINLQSA